MVIRGKTQVTVSHCRIVMVQPGHEWVKIVGSVMKNELTSYHRGHGQGQGHQ